MERIRVTRAGLWFACGNLFQIALRDGGEVWILAWGALLTASLAGRR
ncbi:MAG TPA: hypothetical protein VEA38_03615 [Terriglobales bacterium]|nr:hypothetical protein [Terriglobales bacterium]